MSMSLGVPRTRKPRKTRARILAIRRRQLAEGSERGKEDGLLQNDIAGNDSRMAGQVHRQDQVWDLKHKGFEDPKGLDDP